MCVSSNDSRECPSNTVRHIQFYMIWSSIQTTYHLPKLKCITLIFIQFTPSAVATLPPYMDDLQIGLVPAPHIEPMLVQRCPSVAGGGPTLSQLWFNVSFLLGWQWWSNGDHIHRPRDSFCNETQCFYPVHSRIFNIVGGSSPGPI